MPGVIRLGLCCTFRDAPIRFRRATATHALRLPPDERRAKLAALCDANATALHAARAHEATASGAAAAPEDSAGH